MVPADEVVTVPFPSPEPNRKRGLETAATSEQPSDVPRPKRPVRKSQRQRQDGSKTYRCGTCGERYVEEVEAGKKRPVWLGCSQKNCDYWVHARCLGFIVRSENAFDNIRSFYCKDHRHLH